MNAKIIISATITLLIIFLIGFGISLVLQPGQTTLGVILIIGSVLVGSAALVSGFKDAYDLFEKILSKNRRKSFSFPRTMAKEILLKLNDYSDNGIELDLFLYYLARTYNMEIGECEKIYEELKVKGYIDFQSDFIKITNLGKDFVNVN
jgi:hypothetical protein